MSDSRFVRKNRLQRLSKLGRLAASVTGSVVSRSITSRFSADREATFNAALVDNAQRVARTMGELKGVAMKFGQLLSATPDQLPEEVQRELARLQRDAPPMPYELVAEQFERGTNLALRDAFHTFEPEPIGTASIGQVHRARTFDGRTVAVKVQFPDILETLDADLQNLAMLSSIGRLIADRDMMEKGLAEVRAGILAEADYKQEADNLRSAAAIFEERSEVRIPSVVDEFSADTVLTMEFIEGQKLDDAMAALDTDRRNEVGTQFALLYMWMFHEKQVLHADPHPGNFLYTPDGKIGLLDFGSYRTYTEAFTDGWLKLSAAKWRGETHRLRDLFDELGFRAQKGTSGPSNAQLDALLDATSGPFLEDRDFDWGAWQPRQNVQKFMAKNLGVIQYASPPEGVFYFRVAAGVWGLMQRHGVVSNLYRPARALVEKRGL